MLLRNWRKQWQNQWPYCIISSAKTGTQERKGAIF